MIEYRSVGGLVDGMYVRLGRGEGCCRYNGSSVEGGGGRPVYTLLSMRLLKRC